MTKLSSSLCVMLCLLPVLALCQVHTLDHGMLRAEFPWKTGQQQVEITGLIPGNAYGFRPTGTPPMTVPALVNLTGGHLEDTTSGRWVWVAEATTCTWTFLVPDEGPYANPPTGFSTWDMNRPKTTSAGDRQVFVTPASPQFLVEDILMAGAGCWDVRNITSKGPFLSFGLYSGYPGPGIGACISTGIATDANGINNSGNVGTDFGGWGDADVSACFFGFVFSHDAAALEYDFTAPYTGTLSFNFVFASEEYPSGNCDFFGCFASGPGISGPFTGNAQNFAVVSGTSYYVNTCEVNETNNPKHYIDNTGGKDTQFDGFTVVMPVVIPIQECGDYHIKFVVADTGDGLNDSAVFIEGKTFGYEQTSTVEVVSPATNSNVVYEECGNAVLRVCRAISGNPYPDLPVTFSISPLSTAVQGVDYNPFPAGWVIPAGEECVDIPIDLIYDPSVEPDKTLIVDLDSPCPCLSPSAEIIIRDTPPLEFDLPDITVCQDEDVHFGPDIASGVPDYTFNWSDGSEDAFLDYYAEIPGSQMYSVTVTDLCGRTKTDQGSVSIFPRPTATMEGDGYLCVGNTKDTLYLTITLGPPGSAPWGLSYYVNGVLQPVLSNITQPVIKVPVTSPGYSEIKAVYNNSVCDGIIEGDAFIEPVKITATLDTVGVSCFGIEDGKITATGMEGFPPYTFQWSTGGQTGPVLDSIGVGTYFVTVSDNLGCTVRDSVTLTSQTDILVDGFLVQGTDCKAPTGAVDLTVSGGQGPYSYLWSNGNTSEDPMDLPAGDAFVTVTDTRGCESYAMFPIPIPDAPDITVSATGIVTCAEPGGGSASVSTTGGTAPYNYQWSGNGGTQPDPSGLNPGMYTVTVTDAAGCSVSGQVTIGSDTQVPVAMAVPTDTLTCGLVSLFLDGTGSTVDPEVAYAWSTVNGQILNGGTTLQPEVGLPGTYTLVVTDTGNGCTASVQVAVIPDQNAPQIQIDPADTLTCTITTTILDASGSSSGPEIQIGWSTLNGVILSGGTSLQPVVGAPGTYTLILTNTSNNCIATEDVVVPGLQAQLDAEITSPGDLTCTTPQLILDGSGSLAVPGASFQWTTPDGSIVGPSTGQTVTVDDGGQYILVITDPVSGCTSQAGVQVNVDQTLPGAQIAQPATLTCQVLSVPLNGAGSSTGPDIQFAWTTTGGNLTGPVQQVLTSCDAGGTYTLLVTDTGNGCTATASVTVAMDTLTPLANAGSPGQIDCLNPELTLQGGGQAFSGTAVFQWTTTNGHILTGAQTSGPTIDGAGTYVLTVTDDQNGCTTSTQVVITQDIQVPSVVIAPPGILTCAQPDLEINATGSASGPGIQVNWSTSNGQILTGATTYLPVVGQPGTYRLVIVDTNNGCRDSLDVNVAQDIDQPLADAGLPDHIACLGDTAILDGSGSSTGPGYTHDWYLDLQGLPLISGQQVAKTTQAGTFFLVVTDVTNGCRDTSTVTIPSDFLNDAVLTLVDKYCGDNRSEIHIGPVSGGVLPYTYSIDDGLTQHIDPVFRNLGPGIYPVVVTDSKGCTWREDYEIFPEEGVVVTLPADVTLELSQQVVLQGQVNVDPSTITSLTWYPPYGLDRTDSLTVVASPGIAVTYTLTIEDDRGCVGIDSVTIVVHDPDLFIPTAFTPGNGDAVNDRFLIFGETVGLVRIESFAVYDRWGEQLFFAEDFQPNDPAYGWDGTRDGRAMSPGVYVYTAVLQLTDGRTKTLKGEVLLIR